MANEWGEILGSGGKEVLADFRFRFIGRYL
jgi:hypothetical protein